MARDCTLTVTSEKMGIVVDLASDSPLSFHSGQPFLIFKSIHDLETYLRDCPWLSDYAISQILNTVPTGETYRERLTLEDSDVQQFLKDYEARQQS